MSDTGTQDSGRQLNLGSSGEYTPSARAAKAASSGKGAGAGSSPVVSDGPGDSRSSGGYDTPNTKDMPKQDAGGSPPSDPRIGTHVEIEPGNVRSVNDFKA